MARGDKKRTVHQVISMFGSLGLPVCDDEEAIKGKRDEQRITRNRELNSIKGSVAAKAQQWFDDVNALLRRRAEMLEMLYDEFSGLADAILRADLDGGRTTFGEDTKIALRDIAISWCNLRVDLARKWVRRYLSGRELEQGGVIDQPRLVDDFKVRRRSARIQLTWTVPSDKCEEVRLVRAPDPPHGETEEMVVYQGLDSAFIDTNIIPKMHYYYRAYSVYRGRQSLTSAMTSTRSAKRGVHVSRTVLVAAVVLMAMCGVVYDHYLGDQTLFGDKAGKTWKLFQREDAQTQENDRVWTPVPSGEDDTSALEPANGGTHSGTGAWQSPGTDQLAMGTPDPVPDPSPSNGVPADPAAPGAVAVSTPTALMLGAPNIAFSGQSLRLEMQLSEPMQAELFELTLEGLTLKRLELDADPPAIRFAVTDLADDAYQGRAAWSFRMATLADSRMTAPVSGSCIVMPGL